MTQQEVLTDLSKRLYKLEHQNRTLKLVAFAGAVIVGCSVLMAADGVRQKVMEVEKLVITDATGKARCKLEVSSNGNMVQTFMDQKGNERIRIGVDQDEVARIRMFDDNGGLRVAASTHPSTSKDAPYLAGLSILGCGNKAGDSSNGGIFFQTSKTENASQSVFDNTGKIKAELGILNEGGVYQQFYGAKGNRQLVLSVAPQGDATQFFYDAEGKNRLNQGVTSQGIATQVMKDNNEKARIVTMVVPKGTTADGIAADGCAAQLFFDNNGKLRIDTTTYGDGQASTDYRDASSNRRLSFTMFPDAECVIRHFDHKGQVRQYNGTYANGESGLAMLGRDGKAKFSAMVNLDGSLSHYHEKDTAAQPWEATGNVLQSTDPGKRLGAVGGQDR